MSLPTTFYNSLVDDSGIGDGTIVDKSFIASMYADINSVLDCIDDNGALSFAASTELTIASDAVTLTAGKNVYSVDTEGNAASDNLATITLDASGREARFLILKAENAARVVTVKHGTGNIHLKGGDFAMNDADHRLMLYRDGATWYELARAVAASGGGTNALLDGSNHTDTLAGSVARGDVIIGNSTPKWARLAHGVRGQVLATDGTDALWASPAQICQGRLTLTTAVPVTTSDVTGATTIYFTPYLGNRIALYDGSAWREYVFAERSLALGTLTSGKNYDVFLYDNSGTLTLEFSAAWTNDTTRADALALQDGVYVKSGSTTRRYLGTFRTTSTTATEDSLTKRFVWNRDHPVPRPLRRQETTDSWTYTTNTWRQMNGSTANQVEIVAGLSERGIHVATVAMAQSSGAGIGCWVGIGEDSTSAPATNALVPRQNTDGSSGNPTSMSALMNTIPALGYHYYAALEKSQASSTTTWLGDSGGTGEQAGITAMWWA